MKKYSGLRANAVAALMSSTVAAQSQEVVEWWDFLGGGDGIRMKQIIDDFNAENDGSIQIEATTLEWGVPFYTKVQTSAAVGEGPDVMTYHTSRIPLAVSTVTLQEITGDDMAAMAFTSDSFATATWEAVNVDGTQYAVPMDTHPIVLYCTTRQYSTKLACWAMTACQSAWTGSKTSQPH